MNNTPGQKRWEQTIVDITFQGYPLTVVKVTEFEGRTYTHYDVYFDGLVRHVECSADDAIRALSHYMNGATK